MKSSVLSFSLNVVNEDADLTLKGKLFHASGAATEKPLSPNFSRHRGFTMSKLLEERNRLLVWPSATGVTNSDKYFGAQLLSDLYTSTQSLYVTR